MIAYVFQKYPENFAFQFSSNFPMRFAIFLKSSLFFKSFYLFFSVYKQNFALNNLKTITAINAQISVFVIYVEAIIYLLYNLNHCTFKNSHHLNGTSFKTLND